MPTSKTLHILTGRPISTSSSSNENWLQWVRHDQTGLGEYSEIPAGNDIDIDNDGWFPAGQVPRIVVDLSNAMSQITGKQQSMCANYRVKNIRIGLRANDDALDNDPGGVMFGGFIKYLEPNKHNVNAIKAARHMEHVSESVQFDGDSSNFSTDMEDYTGFRFGWRTELDVKFATKESYPDIGVAAEGGSPSWTLYSDDGALGLIDAYAMWKGRDIYPHQTNALVTDARGRLGTHSIIPFQCCHVDGQSTNANNSNWDWQLGLGANNHISVLGGLMVIDFRFCSIDDGNWLDAVDNDYYPYVTFEVEGWEGF